MAFSKDYKFSSAVYVFLIITTIFAFLYSIGFLSNIEQKISDNLYGGKTPMESIIIIAIDDKSIQEISRWPFDREVFITLFEKLRDAKVVALDVAFFENSSEETDKKTCRNH